jgi:hypothetical protein
MGLRDDLRALKKLREDTKRAEEAAPHVRTYDIDWSQHDPFFHWLFQQCGESWGLYILTVAVLVVVGFCMCVTLMLYAIGLFSAVMAR